MIGKLIDTAFARIDGVLADQIVLIIIDMQGAANRFIVDLTEAVGIGDGVF